MIDRALRILCRLWLFLVAVELVKWVASWLQQKLDYPNDLSYVITAVAKGKAEITNSFLLDGSTEEDKKFVDEKIEVLR